MRSKTRKYLCRQEWTRLENSKNDRAHKGHKKNGSIILCYLGVINIQDRGLFVTPNDTDKMAQSILEHINNEQLRNKIGENAGKRIKALSWD